MKKGIFTNGKNEIKLFNNQGESVLSLEDYWVVQCIDEDRTVKPTNFGIISENAVLVLGSGEEAGYEAGTYSVKEQTWIQELLPGPVSTSNEQGRLHSISIGLKMLDQNFREVPFSDYEFPEEAESCRYAGNGYFLMKKDSRYTIYDAVSKKTGDSFAIPEGFLV